jgi:hypothetical protein
VSRTQLVFDAEFVPRLVRLALDLSCVIDDADQALLPDAVIDANNRFDSYYREHVEVREIPAIP